MLPANDKIAALVTAMHSSNVESMMRDGQWLMWDRNILTLDEEASLREGCERSAAIYKRAGIVLPDRFPVVKVPGRPTETLAPARCFSSYHKTMRLGVPLTEGLPLFEHLLEKRESLCGKGPANAEVFPFSLRSSHMPSVCPPRSFHGAPSEKN